MANSIAGGDTLVGLRSVTGGASLQQGIDLIGGESDGLQNRHRVRSWRCDLAWRRRRSPAQPGGGSRLEASVRTGQTRPGDELRMRGGFFVGENGSETRVRALEAFNPFLHGGRLDSCLGTFAEGRPC